MDILKSLSIIGLLTMAIYFFMVNFMDDQFIPTRNLITQTDPQASSHAITNILHPAHAGAELCNNYEPPVSKGAPPSWTDRNLLGEPLHAFPIKGDPIESNAALFDRTADFGSDVTNINQFYKNNPELFNRVTNVNIDPGWDNQNFKAQAQDGPGGRGGPGGPGGHVVEGWNYNHNYASP